MFVLSVITEYLHCFICFYRGPTVLAASFNRTVWNKKGSMLSDEMRAFNNIGGSRGFNIPTDLLGLIGYGKVVHACVCLYARVCACVFMRACV